MTGPHPDGGGHSQKVEVSMGLPWVRLDTQFASNPKILELLADNKHRAAFAWVCSLAYAGAHGTDGFIPTGALPFLHARKAEATALVEAGLWNTCQGGWEINSWLDFQQSNHETEDRKQRLSERGRKAAAARWEKQRSTAEPP